MLSNVAEHQLQLPGSSKPPRNEYLRACICGIISELTHDLVAKERSRDEGFDRLEGGV